MGLMLMKKFLVAALAALLFPCEITIAAAPAMTDAEMTAVQNALNRGQQLRRYDQIAWHGTDAVMAAIKADGRIAEITAKGGGFLVLDDDSGGRFIIFDKNLENPKPLAEARLVKGVDATGPYEVSKGLLPDLSLIARRMIMARQIAVDALVAASVELCTSGTPNTIILPPVTADAPVDVYFMSSQVKWEEVPAGGHYLVSVDKDGKAGPIRRFTKSCLPMPTDKAKKKPESLVITHLLDPVPTEMHIFTMFAAGLPVYVWTQEGKRLWAVEASEGQARIRLLDSKK